MAWMDWLGGWLRSIVLIVLVATFIDLLLPNQAMQRYVRTVVSLFLLMTLLTPVFQLFQKDWDLQRLLYETEAKQAHLMNSNVQLYGGGSSMEIQNIIGEGEKLRENQALQAKQLLESQAQQWIITEIEQSYGPVVKEVIVQAEIDSHGEATIRNVSVSLAHDRAIAVMQQGEGIEEIGETSVPGRGIASIEPIKPVEIHIDRIDWDTDRRTRESVLNNTSTQLEPLSAQIKQMIHQTLQIPLGQIIVFF